ncbi:cation acetate symporter [Streptomyces sp. S3(2020)]|uniref:sodium/solute symporter n=1 Tax=Streptomyces sp. S3(2020) TaxID=2732044 RepID=UPI001488D088|nr:cation acetate symporter [Streptomyces sp. S3(2020)]NNN29159.1 cation acetate symporter [Streptomyces sp. S3(2020)]
MSAQTVVSTVAAGSVDAVPFVAFLLVVSVTLLLCLIFSADTENPEDVYTAGHSVRPWRNALALTGDSISVLTLLSTTSLVALTGYDGMALATSAVGAFAVLLVLARPLRNVGRFTLGDTLDARFHHRSIRIAATVATLSICIPLAVVQLTASGRATAALAGLTGTAAAQLCTVFIGSMMTCAAALTGMRGNTMLQVVKTIMLFALMGLLVIVLMARMGWSFDRLFADAASASVDPDSYFAPGLFQGTHLTGRLDLISIQVTVVLGSAVAPHLIMRVKAAEHGAAARRSVLYTIGMVGTFCAMAVVLGLGAAALAGQTPKSWFDLQSAASLLSLVNSLSTEWGGELLVALTVSAVFLTSLTVVAALTLSVGAALVHDIYVQWRGEQQVTAAMEVKAMRWATPILGALAVALSVLAQNWSFQFLAQFSIAVTASAILPALLYALFWQRCTRAGIVWSIYTGLGSCVLLQFFGPAVSGTPEALFPSADFSWFPLANVGLVSIPAGFVAGWAASRITPRGRGSTDTDAYASVSARALVDHEVGRDVRST